MKNQIRITVCAITIATFIACGQAKLEPNAATESTIVATDADTSVKSADANLQAASIKDIVEQYLNLKNALVADNGKDAATAGKAMFEAIGKFDKSSLTADQMKVYEDIADDAKEHAEHIGANDSKIDHQREHFVMLSEDMYDLIKALGSPQLLHTFLCPMANGGKGATWLSESEEVKNPYFGEKMMTCGSMKEELK